LKTIRGLLDVDPDLVGDFLQHVAQAQARIEIRPRDHRDEEDGNRGQPAAEAVDGERHCCYQFMGQTGQWPVVSDLRLIKVAKSFEQVPRRCQDATQF
jgi:hypothetical protein